MSIFGEGPTGGMGRQQKAELSKAIEESGLLKAIKQSKEEAYELAKQRGELSSKTESMQKVFYLDNLYDSVKKLGKGKFAKDATFHETKRYIDTLIEEYVTGGVLGDEAFKRK